MKIILIFVFSFLGCVSYAQPGSPFENITTANGLPTNYIFCVQEDVNGFMWAGSDKGLLRYNGYAWEIYNQANGLPGNYVSGIVSNDKDGFAVEISESGFSWWDYTQKRSYRLQQPYNFHHILLTSAYSKPDHSVYFSGRSGDSLYNFKTGNDKPWELKFVSRVKLIPHENNTITNYDPSILQNPTVYVFSNTRLQDEVSFAKYIYPSIKNTISLSQQAGTPILQSSQYIVGADYILKRNGANLFQWVSSPMFEKTKTQCALFINDGALYISKMAEGLRVVSRDGQVKKYTADNGLSSNNVNSFYKGKDSALYISTLGGGINVLRKNNRLKYELDNTQVEDIKENDGFIYLNTHKKIYVLDTLKIVNSMPLAKDILSFSVAGNYLYTGGFEDLQVRKLKNEVLSFEDKYSFTAGISDIIPQKDRIIASTYGSGIVEIRKDRIIGKHNNYPFENIERLLKTDDGFLALSYEKGFYALNDSLQLQMYYTKSTGLLTDEVYYVHIYHDSLFVAGRDGITIISRSKKYKPYSYNQGFKGVTARYIFTDNTGHHWVLSNRFLHKIAGERLMVTGSTPVTLGADDQVNCAYFSTSQQKLYVGTSMGLCVIDIAKVETSEIVRLPGLSSVYRDEQRIALSENYTLPFDYGKINFHFNNINGLFNTSTILYKLQGYNTDFLPLPDSLTIAFEKLRPGTYTLLSKTINADGFESPTQTLTHISVGQIIWLRWWMLSLYAALLAILGFLLVQARQKKRFRKQKEQQKLMTELENERHRISRDLHDNMGAYTTALLSNIQHLQENPAGGSETELTKMKQNASEILNSLKETIWVLNNKEISTHEFSDVFTTYCFKILSNFEHINFDVEEHIDENKMLPATEAVHLNKILQELFHNSLKHSSCTSISYKIYSNSKTLRIHYAENGKGFEKEMVKAGQGLENIRWRLQQISARSTTKNLAEGGIETTIEK